MACIDDADSAPPNVRELYKLKYEEAHDRCARLEQQIEDLKMNLGWAKRDSAWFREQSNKLLTALEEKSDVKRSLQEIRSHENSYEAALALIPGGKSSPRSGGARVRDSDNDTADTHADRSQNERLAQLDKEIASKHAEVLALRSDISNLQQQLCAVTGERDTLRDEVARLQVDSRSLQRQISEFSAQRTADTSRSHHEHAYLEQRLHEVTDNYATLYQTYSHLYHQYMTMGFQSPAQPPVTPHVSRPYGQHWPSPPPPPPSPHAWWPPSPHKPEPR